MELSLKWGAKNKQAIKQIEKQHHFRERHALYRKYSQVKRKKKKGNVARQCSQVQRAFSVRRCHWS